MTYTCTNTILYHPIPHLYTFSSSVYVYVRVMHSKLYLCSKTCNFAVPSHSFSRRMDPSNQIFIKGSPRLWKLCAFRNKGRKGVAINFVTNNDVRIMKDLERPVCLYVCLGTDQNVAATCCYTAFVTVQPLVLPLQVGSCTAKSRSSSLHFLLATSICNLYMSCQSFTIIQHPHKPANVWKVAWDLWMRLAEMGRHLSWKWRSAGHPRYSIVLARSLRRFYHTQIEEMPMDIADLIWAMNSS